MELTAFSETDYRLYARKRAIQTPGGLKFIYSMDTDTGELYNLKEDPHELNNLADKEERTAYELEQKLFAWLNSMGYHENYTKKPLKEMLKIKEY